MDKIYNQIGSQRTSILLGLYTFVLAASFYLAYALRFDFAVPPEFWVSRVKYLVLVVLMKLVLLALLRQFGSLLSYFSIPDLVRIVVAMGVCAVVLNIQWLLTGGAHAPPRGVILADFVLSVSGLCSARLAMRVWRERFMGQRQVAGREVRRIAVFGAGDTGAEFVREAQTKPSLALRPVLVLDDDATKHGRTIHGVPVMGAPEDIGNLRKEHQIDACVLAMPSVPGKRLQEIYKLISREGLKVEIVPSLAELASGRVQVTKIRPVEVEDLLGRATVDLRSPEVAELVRDKVVLITGAGGSIGSELCRQLVGYNIQRLLMVEQAEGSLFLIESELNDRGFGHTVVPLVADILDLSRIRFVIERHRPQIIFHAAAHKHVFMMERQPGEAVKNNTTGTRQLAALAQELGVETFVLISTDKAINPTSAMGASKRLAEMHLQALQAKVPTGTRFIAVRFGNVLGSSGSVIPIFKKQIAGGGPVTVTHPEVTRYFMTIPEAVGLVLQTAVLGKGGEIFVLDMGKPVKIVDLARQLIELSGLRPGEDIEIKFIGLRAGEKLFEELQHSSELLKPTTHTRIQLLASGGTQGEEWLAACIREVEQQAGVLEANQLKLAIKQLVPEYSPHLD